MRRTVGGAAARGRAPRAARRDRAAAARARSASRARFTHQGDPNQAYALIGWSTFGGREHIRERRALALAANMFEARLFDRLREQEGATYSPDAAHLASDSFPDWGIFYAAAEIRPAERRHLLPHRARDRRRPRRPAGRGRTSSRGRSIRW